MLFSTTYYHYYLLRVFRTTVCWWSFTSVWVIASFFKSPGHFSVFYPILVMLLFGWSQFIPRFSPLPVSLPSFWEPFQTHQLLFILLLFLCSITFFSSLAKCKYLSFHFLWFENPPGQLNLLFDTLCLFNTSFNRGFCRSDSKSPLVSRTLLSILSK